MSITKELGKITDVTFGTGLGYRDAMFGLMLTFGGESWGVGDGGRWLAWSPSIIKPDEYTKWTEEDRDKHFARICRSIDKLLTEAKVSNINDLLGIPVEVTFENMTFSDFRILTEVL